jgi:putative transposase
MVALPEQYRWSSVHANLGLREDPLITPHPVFLAQDHDPQARAATYRIWLCEGVGEDELLGIRAHLEQERALGDVKFQAMIEKALGHPTQLRPRGRPRRSDIPPGDV